MHTEKQNSRNIHNIQSWPRDNDLALNIKKKVEIILLTAYESPRYTTGQYSDRNFSSFLSGDNGSNNKRSIISQRTRQQCYWRLFTIHPRMGVDPWVDRGHVPPTFWSGRDALCYVPPTFRGWHFCSAQLHSINYSLQFIWWMLTPLGPNRRVPFHVVITIYDNDVNVMSPLCSCVAPQTLYIWYNRNRQVDN